MSFIEDLTSCLQEENNAVIDYLHLAANAPDEVSKRVILRISREKQRHADFLAWLLEGCEKSCAKAQDEDKQDKNARPRSRVRRTLKK